MGKQITNNQTYICINKEKQLPDFKTFTEISWLVSITQNILNNLILHIFPLFPKMTFTPMEIFPTAFIFSHTD